MRSERNKRRFSSKYLVKHKLRPTDGYIIEVPESVE